MIPELLQRWSKCQPAICRHTDYWFYIGGYRFHYEANTLTACHDVSAADFVRVSGQPALDWLEGAVRRAIEVNPVKCNLQLFGDLGWRADVGPSGETKFYKLATEALLTAWVEYLEGQ